MDGGTTKNQGFSHRSQVDQDGSRWSVLEFLATRFPRDPLAIWRDRILAGEVSINEQRAAPDGRLQPGQWVAWNRPPWVEPEVPLCTAVLYEDEDLLAAAKPSGLPTLPGGGEFLEHTLLNVVRGRNPEASPMHRLGRGTSGLVLFAKSALARRVIPALFRTQQTHKVYRALCAGRPEEDTFRIESPIGKVPHEVLGAIHGAHPEGRASLSLVRVLEKRSGCSLLEVEIPTGRPHQIRIHLAFAGYPLVGDPLFGLGGTPIPGTHALPGDLGYLLHAIRLDLPHPRTGEPLQLFCQPPPLLRQSLY